MWASFFVYAIALAAVLFIPGYVLLRSLTFDKTIALGFAPVVCIVLFCILGYILHEVGVASSAMTYILLLLAVCLSVASVRVLPGLLRKKRLVRRGHAAFTSGCKVFALYVVFGIAAATYMFLLPLDGPGSAVETYDNVHQFGLIRSFVDSGVWCSVHTSLYLDPSSASVDPVPGSGYYPAAFHILAAFIVDAFGCEINVAANVVLFVFVALVFPAEIFVFLRVLFNGDLRRTAFGAPFFALLPSFPWLLVDYWPLYPNAISMILLPTIIVSFIRLFANRVDLRVRGGYAVLFVLSLICAVFSQPNSVFSAAVFLIPFVVFRAAQIARDCCAGNKRDHVWLVGGLSLLACAIVWVALTKAPFLRAVVDFYWPPVFGTWEAVVSVVGGTFLLGGVIPFATVFLIVGFIFGMCCAQTRWVPLSFLIVSAVYVVAVSMGDTWVKHLVSGFWYTDPYRVGAFASLCAVPIAALGVDATLRAVNGMIGRSSKGNRFGLFFAQAALLVICSVGMCGSLFGNGLLAVLEANAAMLNNQAGYSSYDATKREFSLRAAAAVPDGQMILNDPYDGSLFAYGIDGLNLYYRHMSGYDGVDSGWESADSETIRLHACDVAIDDEVRQSLNELGIQYVLKFGESSQWSAAAFPDYVDGDWVGIESIQDDTPGFSVVFSEGNMRLYEIERS